MRKGKENLRPVHFALMCIAAFMAGYMYRSWQEAVVMPPAYRPAMERRGGTNLESDFLQEQPNARPIYILPDVPTGKTGEYL